MSSTTTTVRPTIDSWSEAMVLTLPVVFMPSYDFMRMKVICDGMVMRR